MLLSNNAYNEFKKGLCVCFSKDKKKAVVTTKEEAQKHKKNINEYVNECVNESNSRSSCVADVLGVKLAALSTAFDSFEKAYPQLLQWRQGFYIEINGQEQLLKDKPDDPYYRDRFGTNPLIDCIKYGIDIKKDSHLLMTDGDLALVLDGGDPQFVCTRNAMFKSLERIYA